MSFLGAMNVRYAHTDVTVPNFDDYRVKTLSNEAIKDFRKNEDQRRLDQKSFNYAVSGNVFFDLLALYLLLSTRCIELFGFNCYIEDHFSENVRNIVVFFLFLVVYKNFLRLEACF